MRCLKVHKCTHSLLKRFHVDALPAKLGALKAFPQTSRLVVPDHIQRPPYLLPDNSFKAPPISAEWCILHDNEDRKRMRRACQIAAEARAFVGTLVEAGVTTDRLDRGLHDFVVDRGAYPAPLGYMGFPKSCCTSVNEVVCHGIPDTRCSAEVLTAHSNPCSQLEKGDIVNVDLVVYLDGFFGDCSRMFCIEPIDDSSRRLVQTTKECMTRGIAVAKAGTPLNVIGDAITSHAKSHGFGVVRAYTGHGVGTRLHQPPSVFHHRNGVKEPLRKNMTFTIEPMLTEGAWDTKIWGDQWTVVTVDGGRSAQFEETLFINDDGEAEVWTECDETRFPLCEGVSTA